MNVDGDLIISDRFDDQLNPNSEFFRIFAEIVRVVFPEGLARGGVDTMQLRRMIHQLRYYFDLLNVRYLRQRYPGVSDGQRLMLYDVDCHHTGQLMSRFEPARLHNKMDKKLNVAVMYGWNIKRVYNFNVEFILDCHGNFLFFNPASYDLHDVGGVINCSSFNYASCNDQGHRLLDVYYNASNSMSKDPKIRALWVKLWPRPRVTC